ncbi:MAG: hypothetical protein ABIP79_03290 [Chitinophagaceae bacterium]
MIRPVIKYFFSFLLLTTITQSDLNAQDLTGIWRGYFITESFDHYKFEIQIKQKGSAVSGVSYSYLSTIFYGKATLTGVFNKSGQNALIKEIKTVEVKMAGNSLACIMKCIFQYESSGKEEFLEGTFSSKYEKDGMGVKKGGNCGGGKVYLRKVTTSDFYIEPFLRNKVNPVKTPVIINQPPTKKDPEKTPEKKPYSKPPVQKPVTPPVIKVDTPSKKIYEPPIVKINPPEIIPVPEVIKTRSNELVKVLTVNDPNVVIKIYDNGEIDGDTISVYLDNKLVLSQKRLTTTPLILKLKMDDLKDEHELTMVAENLGSIPPNTSLMIVEAGEQRFEVRITSTEQKNAVVRFRYQKPK